MYGLGFGREDFVVLPVSAVLGLGFVAFKVDSALRPHTSSSAPVVMSGGDDCG